MNRISFVILGSGQDGGVPHPGCACLRCQKARRGRIPRRMSPSAALVGPAGLLLFDASPHLPAQLDLLEGLHLSGLKGRKGILPSSVFLTHGHWGHYGGLGWLGKEVAMTNRIPLYCTPSLAGFLRDNRPWSHLLQAENLEIRLIQPPMPLELEAGVTVTPHRVPHREDVSDTVGFMITFPGPSQEERIFYLPDADYFTDSLLNIMKGCTAAVVDGTFYDRDELDPLGRSIKQVPHPFISESLARLKELLPRCRVVFTHFNHTNPASDPDSPEAIYLRGEGFQLASDGMIVT